MVPERNTRDAPQRTGTVIWDKTEEVKDPETKRVQKRDRPSSEWTVQKQEELRIVSEELWEAVRAQNTLVREKHGPKQLGGMFRTEASRRYLFSGLLRCGFCGANMVITTGVAPNSFYGCPYHRKRGVCQNKLTIKQATLEKQLVGRLVAILQAPEFIAEILEEFARQVSAAVKAEAAAAEQALGMHDELKQENASLCHTVENLTEAIAEHGLSPALSAKLRRCESRMAPVAPPNRRLFRAPESNRERSGRMPPDRRIAEILPISSYCQAGPPSSWDKRMATSALHLGDLPILDPGRQLPGDPASWRFLFGRPKSSTS